MTEWGWTRYERTYRKRGDRKMYVGHFRQDNDPHNYTQVTVKFWAKRPIVALREICQSGRDPTEFAYQAVN